MTGMCIHWGSSISLAMMIIGFRDDLATIRFQFWNVFRVIQNADITSKKLPMATPHHRKRTSKTNSPGLRQRLDSHSFQKLLPNPLHSTHSEHSGWILRQSISMMIPSRLLLMICIIHRHIARYTQFFHIMYRASNSAGNRSFHRHSFQHNPKKGQKQCKLVLSESFVRYSI